MKQLKGIGTSKCHYVNGLHLLKSNLSFLFPTEFAKDFGDGHWLRVTSICSDLAEERMLYTGRMFPKRWLQSVHMSFIIKSHLAQAKSVGCVHWCRVIQDVVVLVLSTGTGCRIGELLLTKDHHPETCCKWADLMIVFPEGIADLWINYEKGSKGELNSWRDITSTYLDIPVFAHMDMVTLVLTYAIRQGRVAGTLEEIINTAAKNLDHAIHWVNGHQPFIHRWGQKKTLPRSPV